MAPIHRVNCRCATCKRWWSVGPHDEKRCPCGGELVPIDMTAHMASLPDGTKVTHNHLSKEPRARGQCEACDHEYLARDRAAAEAKKAKPPT